MGEGTETQYPRKPRDQDQAPLGEINTIVEGFASGGVTASSRKAHTRTTRYHEVYMADKPPKHPKLNSTLTISIGDEDCQGVLYPHNDALVVTLLVANYMTKWILFDNERSLTDSNGVSCRSIKKWMAHA